VGAASTSPGSASSPGAYDLEELRRRADVVEIVSAHVALRKAGRRLTGLCPFHQERTPSFTLDPETGLWYCFGCQAGGDLFRFVEMIEKVTFAEAAALLARRLGVQPRRPAEAARQRQRERLLALHEEAASFFECCLRAEAARPARDYLAKRGLSAQTIKDFRLGYAPPTWDALLKAMAKRGYSEEEIAGAGLAVAQEGRCWDRFRGRIIFPIWDASGRVIAFGGRAMQDDQQPKYLNSPETALFQKGRTLYAFDRARKAMGEAGRAIVVEGYLDAIACHDAGFGETVATMGTALTSEHVEMLRRRGVTRIVLALDADSAGTTAGTRAREPFDQWRLLVAVAELPQGFDPDALVRRSGADALRTLIDRATPMMQWEIARILGRAAGKDGLALADALREAVSALIRVPPGPERAYVKQWLRDHLLLIAEQAGGSVADRRALEGELLQALSIELRRMEGDAGRSRGKAIAQQAGSLLPTARRRAQASVLAAFVQQPQLAARYLSSLEPRDFEAEHESNVFAAIRRLVERGEPVTPAAMLAEIEPQARGLLAQLAVAPVSERTEEEVDRSVHRLLEERLLRQEATLAQRLQAAGSAEEEAAVLQELADCRRRRSELAGRRIVGEE